MDLAQALFIPDTHQVIQSATVTNVHTDGTVDIDLGGARVVPFCRVLATYNPTVGDSVEVIRRDKSSFLVLAGVRAPAVTSPTATVPVTFSFGAAWNILPAPVLVGTTGTLTVNVNDTGSYRSGDWERDDVYQGAYQSARYGYWYGCYFYGSSAFNSLVGKTCTRARIKICRNSAGGDGANVAQYLAPHIHPTQPSSAPYFTNTAVNLGDWDWGESRTVDLPISWGQALIDGDAKGLGHRQASTANYSINASKADDATTGQLILDWKS